MSLAGPAPEPLSSGFAELVARHLGESTRIEEITGLSASRPVQRTFRIELAGGRVLKARWYASEARVQELASVRRALSSDLPLTTMVMSSGAWLFEDWISAERIGDSGSAVAWAGDLLGRIHATRPPAGLEPRLWASVDAAHEELASNLHALVECGALARASADRLLAAVAERSPTAFEHGIVHRDLCPDNVMREPSGALIAVDQGSMGLGPLDADLARVWYRWPMSESERERFHSAYGEHRDARGFFAHAWYYRVLVLSKSARKRLEHGSPLAELPLALLRGMVERRSARDRLAVPEAPATLSLGYDGLDVRVRSSRSRPLAWLAEFLGPGFVGSESAERAIELGVDYDEGLHAVTEGEIACFTVDGRFESYGRCAERDGTAAYDATRGVWIEVGPDRVALRLARDDWRTRAAILRVVRELATLQTLSRGRLLIHASVVAAGGRGVAFCGQKTAGKTSQLLNALRHPGTSFVTNDRASLALDSGLTVRGMPTTVSVRSDSLAYLPGLLERYGDRGFDAFLSEDEHAATKEILLRKDRHRRVPLRRRACGHEGDPPS
jgi:hypothetical protein